MPSQNIAKSIGPPQECLTPGDRALLNAVFGWHMPGAACLPPSPASGGKPVLIPLMAWVIADARRQGEVEGELTPSQFTAAVAQVNRSPTPALHLNALQIERGLRHLETIDPIATAAMLAGTLSAGRATAAAS